MEVKVYRNVHQALFPFPPISLYKIQNPNILSWLHHIWIFHISIYGNFSENLYIHIIMSEIADNVFIKGK